MLNHVIKFQRGASLEAAGCEYCVKPPPLKPAGLCVKMIITIVANHRAKPQGHDSYVGQLETFHSEFNRY